MARWALLIVDSILPRCLTMPSSPSVEIRERAPEILALAENREPAQSGLEPLEAHLLEETPIVGHRLPPFAIVILDVERIGAAPPAAVHFPH